MYFISRMGFHRQSFETELQKYRLQDNFGKIADLKTEYRLAAISSSVMTGLYSILALWALKKRLGSIIGFKIQRRVYSILFLGFAGLGGYEYFGRTKPTWQRYSLLQQYSK